MLQSTAKGLQKIGSLHMQYRKKNVLKVSVKFGVSCHLVDIIVKKNYRRKVYIYLFELHNEHDIGLNTFRISCVNLRLSECTQNIMTHNAFSITMAVSTS